MFDFLPIWAVTVGFIVLSLVAYQVGYIGGDWWQRRTPGEDEGPTGVLVGSLLALMAFLLAIAMGMAADRFDTRRGLVLEQANAIGTTYLRAGYLPAPANEDTRELLREYAPLMIAPSDFTAIEAHHVQALELERQMWSIIENIVLETGGSDVQSTYIESLNDTIDLHESRWVAGVYARVPPTVGWLLIGGSILAIGMLGYGAGLTQKRSVISAVVTIIALAAVITLVVDLDRPRDGFITVSQQPLIDVISQIGPPSP